MSIEDFEKTLEEIWSSSSVQPENLQMPLGQFRKLASERDTKLYALDFIRDCNLIGIPDSAIVVLTPGKVALLTDESGNLLEFS